MLAVIALAVVASPIVPALGAGTAGSAPRNGATLGYAAPTIGRTYTVWPNGVNDTSDLQGAFNHCTMSMARCTVQLEKGTYYTEQIAAIGFRGQFVGAGPGLTTIQALPNLPSPAPAYNTSTSHFWFANPSAQNPWPAMFSFVNGSFGISGMKFVDPYPHPTMGYTGLDGNYTGLMSVIMIDGWHARAAIRDVAIYGVFGDWYGYNINNAIFYVGAFPEPGVVGPHFQYPLVGSFAVRDSYFNTVDTAVWLENTEGTALFEGNTVVTTEAAFGYDDASNSSMVVRDNTATNVSYGAAVMALQSEYWEATGPVTLYVLDNTFGVSYGGNGVGLWDFGTTPGTLTAFVSHNVVRTDTSCGCYVPGVPDAYSALIAMNTAYAEFRANRVIDAGAAGIYVGDSPALIVENRIIAAYDGVYLNGSTSAHVRDNRVINSMQYGIELVNGTSWTMVVHNDVQNSGVYDLYWDQTGTGNVWLRNMYMTSSPGGLSSGHY